MIELYASLAAGAALTLIVTTLLAGWFARLGFPLPPGDRRIGCVDGLRGYLALSVMVYHFFVWTQATRLGGGWNPPPIHFLNQLGTGGVALFFMTTGLVFYPRVLAGWRRTSWPTIYVTRIFRIVPLVVLSVGMVTAIIMFRTSAKPDINYLNPVLRWISTWSEPPLLGDPDAGRINAYVLWSLRFEWLFYIVVLPLSAAVMDLILRVRCPTWVFPAGLLFLSFAARLVIAWLGYTSDFFRYLPLFAIGMLAFESQARPALAAWLRKRFTGPAALVALIVGMVMTAQPYTWSLPLFGFFFICVACGNSLGGLLRLRAALMLGEVSFGIYLLHGIVLDILFVDTRPLQTWIDTPAVPLLLPVAGLAVVPLATMTYLAIERPAMRFGRSLSRRLTGRRASMDSREVEVAP